MRLSLNVDVNQKFLTWLEWQIYYEVHENDSSIEVDAVVTFFTFL